jgi:plasmid maintenance system antidote protein VapI
MDHDLSLSQAARMVGVPRKVLQQQIQQGELSTFEGHLRMSELLKLYPDTVPANSGMLEKVRRIRQAAVLKGTSDGHPDPERMASDVQRLKVQVSMLQDQVESYRRLSDEMADRLVALQESCDKRQSMILGTLIGWYMHQVKMRDGHT